MPMNICWVGEKINENEVEQRLKRNDLYIIALKINLAYAKLLKVYSLYIIPLCKEWFQISKKILSAQLKISFVVLGRQFNKDNKQI